MLDTLLRDKFVLGLKVGRERDRLFEQDSRTLTFAKAVEIAQQAACARAGRPISTDGASSSQAVFKEEPVYKVRERRKNGAASSRASSDSERCEVCGMRNHQTSQCRFKNWKCKGCGSQGHLIKMCSNTKQSVKSQLHNLEVVSDENDDHDCKECDMFNMRYVNSKPIKITVELNNLKLPMELDTGSGTSVISEELYLNNFKNFKLNNTDLKMCLYNGHKIIPLGYFICNVMYLNTTQNIKLYVVQNGGPPLLGRDFMMKFNIYFASSNVNKINIHNKNTEEVQLLLNDFPDLWKDELGCFNKFEVELHLKESAKPIFIKPRSVPFALKNKVEDELDRLVKLGILIPVNFSEFATPIVPVLKENGSVKIAGDFSCTLNKVLNIDKYPLPRIEEVFAKIGGGFKYSKIDLSNAYNQFRLSSSSQELTTINTQKGLFKYTRLVYGLANAPAIFQRAMETLLAGIEGVTCWLDDVCCTAPTRELHLLRLREVLHRLQNAGLRLHKDKCAFFQDSVTYLGYVIDKNGLKTCSNKVDAILKVPTPTNVLEIKRFLGVVNYYRNFIPNASALLGPLHELLRVDVTWHWGERQQNSFEKVKKELASDRVLSHFDPSAPLILTVDAGPAGLGAVLAHADGEGRERPIAFASRSLQASEKVYSQIQKEATAIIFAVKHFHQYLYGRQEPFILKTDHRPLLSIFGNKNGVSVTAALRLQRYAIILSAYNYTVKYVSAKNNLVADFFSRAPLPQSESTNVEEEGGEQNITFLFLDASAKPVSLEEMKHATAHDTELATVMNYMKHGWPRKITCTLILPYFYCKTDLEVINGCLFRGHRLVIPSVFRERMLRELHSAHFGIIKTKLIARSKLWWPHIHIDIERWIGECNACASVRSSPPRAPPASWPQSTQPWYRIHIDYMSIGHCVYLIIIDAFSKWLECIYMNGGTSTAALICKLKFVFSTFGIPCLVVSDNDPKINSSEFHHFCTNHGIKYMTSPVYHPSSNGQAENSVKTCKKMLKCIMSDINNSTPQRVIQEKLLTFLFEYRNTIHCSTGDTPAKLMFGRNIRSRLDVIIPNKSDITLCKEKVQLKPSRSFEVGEIVWSKWFSSKKAIWETGKIIKKIGLRIFEIYFKKYDTVCKRHLDQIRKLKREVNIVDENDYCNEYLPEITFPSASAEQKSSDLTDVSSVSSPEPVDTLIPNIEASKSDNLNSDDNVPISGNRDDAEATPEVKVPVPESERAPDCLKTSIDEISKSNQSSPGRPERRRKIVDYRKYF
ncbi:jg21962 [Pararge aegeria aegeria]|uniref:RNA-directed DNA polymerase n=1 Tax=Pararge aegeria aegeria TaxID=348720 RepID=A0A8S4QX21_9NEOP|nr:jg21962 [Pararge aegeria aegeria]